MLKPKHKKLPLIKNKHLIPKNIPLMNKIQKSKTEKQTCETERSTRKPRLKQQERFRKQKRSLQQKKFSLKKINSLNILKTLKDTEANTDDNSDKEESRQKYLKKDINNNQARPIISKAIDLLKGMKQVQKVAKLYKKPLQMSKNSESNQESKKVLKNKYKCLVNLHVFQRKLKTNGSEVVKSNIEEKNRKDYSGMNDNFWDRIDQSLIIESCRHEEPSKQLMDLVRNMQTEC